MGWIVNIMSNEKGHNKSKREKKKSERIIRLLDVEFCACGTFNKSRCHGLCKNLHTNSKTGEVECGEMYQIDLSTVKQGDSRSPKRNWKYGRQKVVDENISTKQQRRDKIERDRS